MREREGRGGRGGRGGEEGIREGDGGTIDIDQDGSERRVGGYVGKQEGKNTVSE